MGTADIWATLTQEERAMALSLLMPSMRKAPLLLTLRERARTAQLARRGTGDEHGGLWLPDSTPSAP